MQGSCNGAGDDIRRLLLTLSAQAQRPDLHDTMQAVWPLAEK